MLPSGKTAKRFKSELTFWLNQFNQGTKLHRIVLKAFMLIQNLEIKKTTKRK